MTDQDVRMPNYPAFFVLLLTFVPIIIIEMSTAEKIIESDFFTSLKDNFGFFMFFQIILYGFTFSQSIIQYDQIPKVHHVGLVILLSVFGFSIIALLIAWMGYFNAGMHTFIWLNL
jgi:hypothetical protein